MDTHRNPSEIATGIASPPAAAHPTRFARARGRKRMMLLAFVTLVVVGQQITPARSRAATQTIDTPGLELGALASRSVKLEMTLKRGVVRYRILAADGKVIAPDMDEETLAAKFPLLDMRKLHAQRLMLVEPRDDR